MMQAEAMLEDDATTPMPPRPPGDGAFAGWDAPEDSVSITGIMRLEDVAPSQEQTVGLPASAIAALDRAETVSLAPSHATRAVEQLNRSMAADAARALHGSASLPGVHSLQGGKPIDDAATKPSAATRLRRPHDAGSSFSRQSRPEVHRRSRLPMVAGVLMSLIAVMLVIGGGVILVPVVIAQTNGFGRLAPESVAGTRVAEVERPAPAGPTVQPEQVSDAAGASPVPPVPAAVDPGSADPPKPAQSKATTQPPAPIPAPTVAPKSVPAAPVPAAPQQSTTPPMDVQGLWVGSTTSNKSFKLTVLGQTDGDFEGTVDISLDDGTYLSLAIQGRVDGSGTMTFRGSGATFTGKVNGDGRRASGTYTINGQPSVNWTGYH